jgi:hypothetical protein
MISDIDDFKEELRALTDHLKATGVRMGIGTMKMGCASSAIGLILAGCTDDEFAAIVRGIRRLYARR